MTSPRHHTQDDGITGRVRRNAGPAGVAAACLLLFGFGAGFASQRVTDLFTLGDAVFNYTLRIGGVLMAGVAIWSLTGRVAALLIDALVSIAIGALMVFSGSAMMAGGGGVAVSFVLYLLFGGMFISAGVRGWRDYSWLTVSAKPGQVREAPSTSPNRQESVPEATLPARSVDPPIAPPVQSTTIPTSDEQPDEETAPTPDGLLASFADQKPPRRI